MGPFLPAFVLSSLSFNEAGNTYLYSPYSFSVLSLAAYNNYMEHAFPHDELRPIRYIQLCYNRMFKMMTRICTYEHTESLPVKLPARVSYARVLCVQTIFHSYPHTVCGSWYSIESLRVPFQYEFQYQVTLQYEYRVHRSSAARHMDAYISTRGDTFPQTYLRKCIHAYMDTRIHIYTPMYIKTHTHAQCHV